MLSVIINLFADHWNTLVLNKRQLVGANLVPLRVEVSERRHPWNGVPFRMDGDDLSQSVAM